MNRKQEYNHELFRTMRAIAGEIADTPDVESQLVMREAIDDALSEMDSFFDGELRGEARAQYLQSLESNKDEAEAFGATRVAVSLLERDRLSKGARAFDRSQGILERYEFRRTYMGPGARKRRGNGPRRLIAAGLIITAGAAALVGGYAVTLTARDTGVVVATNDEGAIEHAAVQGSGIDPDVPAAGPVAEAPEHHLVMVDTKASRGGEYQQRLTDEVRRSVMAAHPKMVWAPDAPDSAVLSAATASSHFGVEATLEPRRDLRDMGGMGEVIWLSSTDDCGSVLWSITPLEDEIPLPFLAPEMLSERAASRVLGVAFEN